MDAPKDKRRFMLAWRHGLLPSMLTPMQAASLEGRVCKEVGLDFNGGRRRPPADWMAEMADNQKVQAIPEAIVQLGGASSGDVGREHARELSDVFRPLA